MSVTNILQIKTNLIFFLIKTVCTYAYHETLIAGQWEKCFIAHGIFLCCMYEAFVNAAQLDFPLRKENNLH